MSTYSIIVPVYNEEVYLLGFFERLKASITEKKEFEIIFVNDGCTDYSVDILKKIANENDFVKVINLKKNYGKQIAITAGMKYSTGKAVMIMSIKQGEPYIAINAMISAWLKGGEIVLSYRNKKHNKFKIWWQNLKHKMMQLLMRAFNIEGQLIKYSDAELYDRKVVDVINSLPDKNMYLRRVDVLFGYKRVEVEFEAKLPTQQEIEADKHRKIEFLGTRISENKPEPQKVKRRLYAPSLWISLGGMVFTGVFFITAALINIFSENIGITALFMLLALVSLVVCVLFYIKSLLMKRVGVLLPKRENLYEIESTIN